MLASATVELVWWQDPMVLGAGGGLGLLAVVFVVAVAIFVVRSRKPALDLDEEEPLLEASEEASAAPVEPVPSSLLARMREALGRSREALQGRLDTLFGSDLVDEALYEELELILLGADVGLPTTERLIDLLRKRQKEEGLEPAELREVFRSEVTRLLEAVHKPLKRPDGADPWVILVVGVNGSGKTTTIGKLSARFQAAGHRVLLAAGDTYRAAAADQLEVWAERAGVDIVREDPGADPGAVVFNALQAAKARGHDTVLVDTAGRLQTARPLMEQLSKIRRVIDKVVPGAPHDTLLVLDGTMGQNGLSQAATFNEATPLSGVAVTKLDGTAKGGMIVTISAELELPIQLIGIGEQMDDLRDFEPKAFVEALT